MTTIAIMGEFKRQIQWIHPPFTNHSIKINPGLTSRKEKGGQTSNILLSNLPFGDIDMEDTMEDTTSISRNGRFDNLQEGVPWPVIPQEQWVSTLAAHRYEMLIELMWITSRPEALESSPARFKRAVSAELLS